MFYTVMLTLTTFLTGFYMAQGSWILMAVNALCTTYWLVQTIRTAKKKSSIAFNFDMKDITDVNLSEETKEALKNAGIKVMLNGKEI